MSFNFGGALLGSGLGGGLSSLFGNETNPMDSANQYLSQIPSEMQKYMNPYLQAGSGALGTLGGQYNNLLTNPGGMMNQIGQSYHQSPGFQFALHQALMGANNASAAGGMAGSPLAQQQNMGIATQMGNQDYYNYLNNALGMYGQGLQGEQGLAGLGMQGATNMSDIISNMLQNQAAMAYGNQASKNQSQNSAFGDLGGIVGGLIPGALHSIGL